MDFVISDDGELLSYSGLGGSVVIPEGVKFIARDGVFDPQVKITALTLPSTLLGHKHEQGSDHQAHVQRYNNAAALSVELYQKDGAAPLEQDDVLFELLELKLPFLESYAVAADNAVYSERSGVLMFQDKFILDTPSQSSLPLSMDSSYQEYIQSTDINDALQGPPVIVTILDELVLCESLDNFLQSEVFEHGVDNLLIVYAPNANEFFKHYLTPRHNLVIVAPKYQVHDNQRTFCWQSLCGFCYKSDAYDEQNKAYYSSLLLEHENKVYPFANEQKLTKVLSYYKNVWAQESDPSKQVSNAQEAALQIKLQVLYGSERDFKHCLKNKKYIKDKHIELVTIVELALRYGGLAKLKALLNESIFSESYRKHLDDIFARSMFSFGLWQVIGYEPRFGSAMTLNVDKHGEVHGLKPISIEERLECIELLTRQLLRPNYSKEWRCFYGYMLDRQDLIADLISKVCLKTFITDNRDVVSQIERDITYTGVLSHKASIVVNFAKLINELGVKLPISVEPLKYRVSGNVELIKELFPLITVKDDDMFEVLSAIVRDDDIDSLKAALDSSYDFSSKLIKKLVQYASDKSQAEMVAIILDYQDKLRKHGEQSVGVRSSLTL